MIPVSTWIDLQRRLFLDRFFYDTLWVLGKKYYFRVRSSSSASLFIKEALCLRLVCSKPEKLKATIDKRRYDGLRAYSVGLLSHICLLRFLRAWALGRGAYSSTLLHMWFFFRFGGELSDHWETLWQFLWLNPVVLGMILSTSKEKSENIVTNYWWSGWLWTSFLHRQT